MKLLAYAPKKIIPPVCSVARCSSSRHKGPSSRLPSRRAVANSVQLRSVNPDRRQSVGAFPLCLGKNRVIPLATELSHGECTRERRSTRARASFILRRALSRYRRRHRTWFSLANFHGPCKPPCSVSLFLSAYSGRFWKLGPEVDDLERVCSQPSRSLTSASELASFAGLSETERILPLSFVMRRGKSSRGEYQVEFPPWDISKHIEDNASLVGKIRSLTNFRTRPREIPLGLFLTRVPPHYFLFHSIFTLTSGDASNLTSLLLFAPHEIFFLIRGEVTKTLPSSHSQNLRNIK